MNCVVVWSSPIIKIDTKSTITTSLLSISYTVCDSVLKGSTNNKKMWDNLNEIINKNRPPFITHPASISRVINKYLCNVPAEIASNLPKADRHFLVLLCYRDELLMSLRMLDGKLLVFSVAPFKIDQNKKIKTVQ